MLDDNYLAHYGIKGQKWGIRRFQNEDGSLTAEGRAKYGNNESGKSDSRRALAKKVAIGTAAVAATAALGFLAYKKSTKLRDIVRSEAQKEARDWMNASFSATMKRTMHEIDARENRSMRNYAMKKGNASEALKRDSDMRKSMQETAKWNKIAKNADSNYKMYDNMAKKTTRRDAVRLALNERVSKRSSKKAKSLVVINKLNRDQKRGNFGTRWSIDGTMYKVRKGK